MIETLKCVKGELLKMLDEIHNYEEIIYRKHPKYIYIWLYLIILIIVSFCVIVIFYKYNKFYYINGVVVKIEQDNYIQVLIKDDDIAIMNDYDLIINQKQIEFCYQATSLFYTDTGKIYREVNLFFENNYENNEIISLTFVSPKTTIFKQIKEKIRKGMV